MRNQLRRQVFKSQVVFVYGHGLISFEEIETDQIKVICLYSINIYPLDTSYLFPTIRDKFKSLIILDNSAHLKKLPGPAIRQGACHNEDVEKSRTRDVGAAQWVRTEDQYE